MTNTDKYTETYIHAIDDRLVKVVCAHVYTLLSFIRLGKVEYMYVYIYIYIYICVYIYICYNHIYMCDWCV